VVFTHKFNKENLKLLIGCASFLAGFILFFSTYPSNMISSAADATLSFGANGICWFTDSFKGLIEEIKISREAKEKIRSLERENGRLRDMIADNYEIRRENARLFKYFGIKKENPEMKFIYAKSLGSVPFMKDSHFLLDCGSKKGASIGDSVITEKGFLGWLCRVGPYTSTVKTIFASDCNLGVTDSVTGNSGIISGTKELSIKNLTKAINLCSSDAMEAGNIVTTSGASGIYPKGLKVGTIKSVEHHESTYYAIIEPFQTIEKIQNVFVITNFAAKGIII
jgi:rod shape-determining protein MreC